MRGALIHRARETGTRPQTVRSAQGQYDADSYEGPWVAVRFMERGVAPRARRDDGTSARQARTYELLADYVTLDVPASSFALESGMQMLVIAPPVTPADGWTVQVDGEPELLNNGVDVIGWYGNVTRVGDAA